jgi:arylamine N-acetyltransferase
VPFENLSLHYSQTHLLSLDPEDLFVKIVDRKRGGYCMENNAFFGAVLRSLGYDLINAGARIADAVVGKTGDGFEGWWVAFFPCGCRSRGGWLTVDT